MSGKQCGLCDSTARWEIFAAYDAEMDGAHPRVARYPAVMARSCNTHLVLSLGQDAATHNSTMQWVVRPC